MKFKTIRTINIILIILFILSFTLCQENTVYENNVKIYPFNPTDSHIGFKNELIINGLMEVRGGWAFMHNCSMKKYRYDLHYFLYTNKLSGRIEADSLIFAYHQGNLDNMRKFSALKGYIEFIADSLEINLKIPVYLNGSTIDHWNKFEQNGKYKIIIKNEYSPKYPDFSFTEKWF